MRKLLKILLGILFTINFFIGAEKIAAQDAIVKDTVKNEALFYNDLGIDKYNAGDIDSCLIYLDKAVMIAEKEEDWKLFITISSNIYALNYMLGNHEAAEKGILRSEKIFKDYIEPNSRPYAQACSVLGIYYKERGDFSKTIEYNNKIIEADSIFDDIWISAMRSSKGIYQINGDYEKAMEYQIEIKEFIENSDDYKHLMPEIYWGFGELYYFKEQKDSAQVYYLKSKKMFDESSHNKNIGKKGIQVSNLGSLIEFSLENENSNLNTLELLNDFEALYDENYRYRKNELYLNYALFYESRGEIELIEKNLEKAKIEAEKIYNGYDSHPALAKAYEYSAKFLFKRGEYSKALLELKSAFNNAMVSSPESNKSVEYYQPTSFLDNQQGIRFLKLKIKCHEGLYEETKDLEQLKKAGQTYENLSDLVLHFRDIVQNQSSELDWSQRLTEIYRNSVKNAVTLYEKTNDIAYLEKAFHYSECNKAATLVEKVSYEKTLKNILPEKVLKDLQDLRMDIAFYQKQINKGQQKAKQDSTKIAEWAQVISTLENEYKSLEKEVKTNYPDYAKASKTFKPSTVKELRKEFLKDNTALIEYFSTDDSWYVFTLTKTDLIVQEIPKDELFTDAFAVLTELISQQPNSSTYVQDLKDFSNNSHRLYEILIQKSLVKLPKTITSLLIIPDGQLAHLPFELLLTDLPKEEGSLSYLPTVMPYFFNEYDLSYGFSATVANLTNQNQTRSNSGAPAIFSPSFSDEYLSESRSCQEGGLSYLKCNAKEGELIKDLVRGDFFAGDLASIQSFREVAANAPILHLATHACIDEENLAENKIFFADSYLTNDDLNTVGVNADLVVLSACDTGLGVMIKGEGLMSLSRGFLCAGAASTVMSLWSVDDCATSDLMISFYEELKNGEEKSTALKNAKLTYLSQADKLHQHPYFWAPFVLSGNVESIKIGSSVSPFVYIGGTALLLLLAFWTYRKTKV